METSKNSKGFAPIVIILIVLALIGGVYYLGTLKNKPTLVSVVPTSTPVTSLSPTGKPSNDPTAHWKTFNNPTTLGYKYSVMYPLNYSVVGDNTSLSKEENNKSVCITSLKNFCQFRINVFSQDPIISLEGWINQNRSYINQSDLKPFTVRDYKVLFYSNQGQSVAFLQRANFIVEIIAPDDEIHKQILSTFKFTK